MKKLRIFNINQWTDQTLLSHMLELQVSQTMTSADTVVLAHVYKYIRKMFSPNSPKQQP